MKFRVWKLTICGRLLICSCGLADLESSIKMVLGWGYHCIVEDSEANYKQYSIENEDEAEAIVVMMR